MDVARPPEVAQRKKRNRIIAGAAVALLVIVTTVALARLKPAAPTVEAGGLWIEPVKRGTMLRNVRGTGVLVPDEIRWITALTDGTVERVVVLPGTPVEADTVLLELSNPQTQQAAMTADLDLRTAKDNYEVLKADLERDLLAQRAAAAAVAVGCRAGADERRRRRADGQERASFRRSSYGSRSCSPRRPPSAAEDGRAAAGEQRADARGEARRAAVRSAAARDDGDAEAAGGDRA